MVVVLRRLEGGGMVDVYYWNLQSWKKVNWSGIVVCWSLAFARNYFLEDAGMELVPRVRELRDASQCVLTFV